MFSSEVAVALYVCFGLCVSGEFYFFD